MKATITLHMMAGDSIARVGGGFGAVSPKLEIAASVLGMDAYFGNQAARQVTEGTAPNKLWEAFVTVVGHVPDPRVVPAAEFVDPRLVRNRPRKLRSGELILP